MNAAPMGMTTRKIIVVPCMVKTWLYRSALRSLPSGVASWRRMRRASMPPNRKKNSAAAPYMMAIFLWSTVVTQLRQPVDAVGRANTPEGRSFATSPVPRARGASMELMTCSFLLQGGQEGDQIVDLIFGQVEVVHAAAVGAGHLAGHHRLLGGSVAEPGLELLAVEALGDALLGAGPVLAERLARRGGQ